jgi:HD-GYP domain-containing protein (c-di-GMP phosphodiesterase class II)
LPVYELRQGMFVSNVDCGWNKTPFMLEGLLITAQEQIETLAKLTEYVTVDPTRSIDLALTEHLEKTFGSGKYGLGYDDAETISSLTAVGDDEETDTVSPAASQRIELDRLTHVMKDARPRTGWWHRFTSWSRLWRGSAQDRAVLPPKAHPVYIPKEIPLVSYPEPEFSWPTVPVAVTACKAALSLLSDVAQGIAARQITDFQTLERAAQTMAEHMIAHPNAIMWAAKMLESNNKLYQRSLEVGIHLTILGRHLGFPRELLADLAMTGFLLDLGKIKVNPELLDKPGQFTDAETQAMHRHVLQGIAMLEHGDTLSDNIMRAIAEHHERVDGNGYPKGLRDVEISLYGKMAAIVDAYVAMINPRPYAKTFAPHEAVKELFAGVDTRWYGPLVEQFVQAIGVFPVGSLVEMANGHIAIVIQHNPIRRLEPKILIVTRIDKSRRPVPLQIDMLRHNERQKEKRLQILRGLPDGSYGIHVRDYYFGSR